MKHEPANTIIAKFGGHRAVADIVGKDLTRVYRWTYPRDRGGTGGIIPQSDAVRLLEHAKENGVPVSADDFFATNSAYVSPADQPLGDAAAIPPPRGATSFSGGGHGATITRASVADGSTSPPT